MTRRKTGTGKKELREVTDAEIDAAIASFAEPAPAAPATQLHDLFNQQVRQVLDASDLGRFAVVVKDCLAVA